MIERRRVREVTHNGQRYRIVPVPRTTWWNVFNADGQLVAAGPSLAWATRELVRLPVNPSPVSSGARS